MTREEFFSDCAASYPKSLLAIAHLRDYVREECRTRRTKHVEEIAHILGSSPKEIEILSYAQPDQLTTGNPDELYLGAKIRRAGKEMGWAYLYWLRDSEVDPFMCGVGFDLLPVSANRDKFLAALDAAIQKKPFVDDDWWDCDPENNITCWIELEADRLGSFGSELNRLVARVLEAIQTIPNVSRFFRK
jgi:hypothetical protein